MRLHATVLSRGLLVVGVAVGAGCTLSTSGTENAASTASTTGAGGATTGNGGTSHGGQGTGGAAVGGFGGAGGSTGGAGGSTGGAGGSTGGAGGHGGTGGAGGAPVCDPACAAPKVPDCETIACKAGKCESTFAAPLTKLATQTAGDCRVWVCDGKGGVLQQVDDTNSSDDNDCTDDACNAGVATHSPSAAELPCAQNGGKVCDGNGACVACVSTPDCADITKFCEANICVTKLCQDGKKDGSETDTDCGGLDCAPCGDGLACLAGTDCASHVCDAGMHCAAPGCGDGVKNGDETDTDCGGSCPSKCGPNQGCAKANDCVGGDCNGSTCVPNCLDKVQNGAETAVDCGGGTCGKCAEGQGCAAAGDCVSNGCCNTPNGTCSACCDGAKDGSETGVDCGGSCSQKCADGLGCAGNADCVSALCQGQVCRPGTCTDGGKDGNETDLDCGGSCLSCAQGKVCKGAADCIGGVCNSGKCEGPSCAGGLNCGGVSCCDASVVPGGTFPMGRSAVIADPDYYPSGGASELPQHDVTLADFRLDTFEVTVGRFRKFVAAFNGTPPAVNAGAHPLIANSGWQAGWNASLAASQATLVGNLKCSALSQTWTDAPGANESDAINCVSWYEAAAFCAWDGGRVPTEAEWEYASAGGSENRLFPWGSTDPAVTKTLANDGYSDKSPFIAVGSHPSGNGKWGHRDLAGGMWEWNLDWYDANWYSGAGKICSNCADLTQSSSRVIRSGAWNNVNVSFLRAALRNTYAPTDRGDVLGFRCAR